MPPKPVPKRIDVNSKFNSPYENLISSFYNNTTSQKQPNYNENRQQSPHRELLGSNDSDKS